MVAAEVGAAAEKPDHYPENGKIAPSQDQVGGGLQQRSAGGSKRPIRNGAHRQPRAVARHQITGSLADPNIGTTRWPGRPGTSRAARGNDPTPDGSGKHRLR